MFYNKSASVDIKLACYSNSIRGLAMSTVLLCSDLSRLHPEKYTADP